MSWRETQYNEPDCPSTDQLKICGLCGTLNLESNAECFVCSWHGQFDRTPTAIAAAIDLIRLREGRVLLSSLRGRPIRRSSVLGRWWNAITDWLFGPGDGHPRPGLG